MKPLISIQLEPTTRCNFSCTSCTRREYVTDEDLDLPLETFREILRQRPTLKEIKLQGFGEPLLYRHFDEIVTEGAARGIRFTTFSNGTALTRERIDTVLGHFDIFFVSLDSLKEERFGALRPGPGLAVVLQGMEKLSRRKKALGSATRLAVNFVASHINFDEIKDLGDLARNLGFDAVQIVEAENWNLPGQDGFRNISSFVRDARAKAASIALEVQRLKESCAGKPVGIFHVDGRPRRDLCLWPFYFCHISAQGYVTPCCLRGNPRVVNFGNILERSLDEIWNGDEYVDFRTRLLSGAPDPLCDTCPD
jgi:MoaA/NifB/PqqE/SkfB family radical SAM enzyme